MSDANAEQPALCECADDCGAVRAGPFGDRRTDLVGRDRHTNCFGIARGYVEISVGATLIHDRAMCAAPPPATRLVMGAHAWVVEADGWTWDPVLDRWYHDDDAYVATSVAKPINRYTRDQTTEMHAQHGNFGPWENLEKFG